MNKNKNLSPYEKAIRNRIQKLIDEYCDGSQKKFVDKTGLNKGSVSQYVNGKNTPSWENAEKIAAAFNIDVQWVMAVDTIPDVIPDYVPTQYDEAIAADPKLVLEALTFYEQYQRLTPENQIAFRTLLKSLQSDS